MTHIDNNTGSCALITGHLAWEDDGAVHSGNTATPGVAGLDGLENLIKFTDEFAIPETDSFSHIKVKVTDAFGMSLEKTIDTEGGDVEFTDSENGIDLSLDIEVRIIVYTGMCTNGKLIKYNINKRTRVLLPKENISCCLNYSLQEQLTNRKWIDGSDVFERVFEDENIAQQFVVNNPVIALRYTQLENALDKFEVVLEYIYSSNGGSNGGSGSGGSGSGSGSGSSGGLYYYTSYSKCSQRTINGIENTCAIFPTNRPQILNDGDSVVIMQHLEFDNNGTWEIVMEQTELNGYSDNFITEYAIPIAAIQEKNVLINSMSSFRIHYTTNNYSAGFVINCL